MPPTQTPLQQSAVVLQPELPNGMQHVPLVPQVPEQQSKLLLQVLWFARQAQVLVVVLQRPEQHCELLVQPPCKGPSGMQSTHLPWGTSQAPEQHCEPILHTPFPLEMQATQEPPPMPPLNSQAPEQHSGPLEQPTVLLFGRQHLLLEQTWPLPVQAVLQLPQWLAFEVVSKQVPLQLV
jgi:hypothetical protein